MPTETTIEIATLMPWGEPKTINVRGVDKILRKAAPTEAFWQVWRSAKEQLKAAGVTCGQYQGQWEVCWWRDADPEAQAKLADEQQKLAKALAGEVAVLPDEYENRMRQFEPMCLGYQVPSVRRQVQALLDYRKALDASDTGTGKTYVTLATCAVLGLPLCAVCPIAVRTSWRRAADHFGVKMAGVWNYELLREGSLPEICEVKFKWVTKMQGGRPVMDKFGQPKQERELESVTWKLPKDTVIAFDECHRMKNYTTLNCALGLAALRQGYRVIGASATAADNPMQMKFAALLTGMIQSEREFYPWMLRNGVERGRFGLEFNGGRAALERIHKSIFPLHGTRIRIADLGDQFPETQITAECYETDAEAINRVNEEMAEEIARIRASEMEDAKKQACILTEQLRARQRTEIIKVPAAVDMIEDWVDDGMSVAVFVNFKETLAALAAKLKTKCVIQGDQSETERQANIDAFQQDKAHVILAIIQAGGVGVSLHGSPTSRMRASLIFPCWSGQDMKQAFGRVWRANGAKSIQRIFFAAGTIEQDVCDGVNAKISRIDVLNDGIPDEVLRLKGECVDFAAEASERLAFVRPPAPRQANGATSVTFQPAPERPTVTYTPSPEEQKRKERRDKDAKLAARLTREQIDRAHRAMQQLAACDPDHARDRNDAGFSSMDGRYGHQLANSESLTPLEGAAAVRLARKYRRQVGDLFPEIYGGE